MGMNLFPSYTEEKLKTTKIITANNTPEKGLVAKFA